MEKDLFKEIAENLVTLLPENWEKVCLYCYMAEYEYEFFFYVKIGGKYIQCFNLEEVYGISEESVLGCFDNLHDILFYQIMRKKSSM